MRAWLITPIAGYDEDVGYALGYLTAISERLFVSRIGTFDEVAPDPPLEPIDLIIDLSLTRSRAFLMHLDSIALGLGVPLTNPAEASWRAIDKRCYPADFPGLCPRTLIAADAAELRAAWIELGRDAVVKDPFGAKGYEVERICTLDDLVLGEQLLANSRSGDVVVQEFCLDRAMDKRVMVQRTPEGAHKVIGQFGRIAPDGGWKCNLSSGGRMVRCQLSDEETDLASKVSASAGLDFLGIDLMTHLGRPVLIETNSSPYGLIDYDTDIGARSIEAYGKFLLHLSATAKGPGQI